VLETLRTGAAGQAEQNFNVMTGWNVETGLTMTPIYP
ncbi:N-acetyl-gamma-glutamyl-phosphate reductase, partial [Bacillus vallismortis]|nr:N-acetyl-gamma-glutamyl-phosphate reductase [Bacillus vallismortis]